MHLLVLLLVSIGLCAVSLDFVGSSPLADNNNVESKDGQQQSDNVTTSAPHVPTAVVTNESSSAAPIVTTAGQSNVTTERVSTAGFKQSSEAGTTSAPHVKTETFPTAPVVTTAGQSNGTTEVVSTAGFKQSSEAGTTSAPHVTTAALTSEAHSTAPVVTSAGQSNGTTEGVSTVAYPQSSEAVKTTAPSVHTAALTSEAHSAAPVVTSMGQSNGTVTERVSTTAYAQSSEAVKTTAPSEHTVQTTTKPAVTSASTQVFSSAPNPAGSTAVAPTAGSTTAHETVAPTTPTVLTATLIQQHWRGTTFFVRDWADFKAGFGDATDYGNYWIGNDRLHELTKDGQYKLTLELQAAKRFRKYYAEYSTFIVDDESTDYMLYIGGYNGTAGDSLSRANGTRFSTRDRDNDVWAGGNCATQTDAGNGAGFWYSLDCGNAFPNSPADEICGFSWMDLPTRPGHCWQTKLVHSRMTLVPK